MQRPPSYMYAHVSRSMFPFIGRITKQLPHVCKSGALTGRVLDRVESENTIANRSSNTCQSQWRTNTFCGRKVGTYQSLPHAKHSQHLEFQIVCNLLPRSLCKEDISSSLDSNACFFGAVTGGRPGLVLVCDTPQPPPPPGFRKIVVPGQRPTSVPREKCPAPKAPIFFSCYVFVLKILKIL